MERYVMSHHFAFWIVAFALLCSNVTGSYAQWRIGASYQYRVEGSSNGMNAQLSRQFSTSESWLDVFVRGHASYFFKQKERIIKLDTSTLTETRSFDGVLSGGVEASLSRFHPYVGMGGGYEWLRGESVIRGTEIDSGAGFIARYVGLGIRMAHGF